MNILVVDDEAVMVESITIGLESSGYRVVESFSAQQALDHLNHGGQMIDLVVTDHLMPKMNGILPKIVHQINNPLLSISGFAELIQMNVGNIEKLQIYAEKILSAVQHICL